MLTNLNWSALGHCRAEQKAVMMFKIVNHLIDIPANSLLQLFIIQEATIGDSHNQWQELILIYIHFFHPQSKFGIRSPHHVIDSENTDQFKQRLGGLLIN